MSLVTPKAQIPTDIDPAAILTVTALDHALKPSCGEPRHTLSEFGRMLG